MDFELIDIYTELSDTYPLDKHAEFEEDDSRFLLIDQIFLIINRQLPLQNQFETSTQYFLSLYYYIDVLDDGEEEDEDFIHAHQYKETILDNLIQRRLQFLLEFLNYCFQKRYLDKNEQVFKIAISKALLERPIVGGYYVKRRIENFYELPIFEYIIYELLDTEFVCSLVDSDVGSFLHHLTESSIQVPQPVLDTALSFFDRNGFNYATPTTQLDFLRYALCDFQFDTIEKFVRRGARFGDDSKLAFEVALQTYTNESHREKPNGQVYNMKFFFRLFQLFKDVGYPMEYFREMFNAEFSRPERMKFCTEECPVYFERCHELLR